MFNRGMFIRRAGLVRVGANNAGKSYARSRSVTGGLTNGSPGRPVSPRQVTDLARALFSRTYLRRTVLGTLLVGIGFWLGALVCPIDSVHAQAERPNVPNMDPASRMAPPPMSDPPTHLEWGHYNYWLSCMVCHGDRGQGLTDEWRTAGNADGENCWQARCHAASHPPEGFDLPRVVPPVIGQYALLRFQTVGDLRTYLQETMPWYAPGLLDDETYWQLATYLAHANGTPNIPDNPEWALLADLPMRLTSPLSAPPSQEVAQETSSSTETQAQTWSWLPALMMVLVALGASIALGVRRRL